MVRQQPGFGVFKHVERLRSAASQTAQPRNVHGAIVATPDAAEINQQRIVNAAIPALSEHPGLRAPPAARDHPWQRLSPLCHRRLTTVCASIRPSRKHLIDLY
jgi:hypothetical protein